MFQSLIKNPREVCVGRWYVKYPTLQNSVTGKRFDFELLGDETNEHAHMIDNLKCEEEHISIRTSWRFDFASDHYVAAFGNLYKIERITRTRQISRGVAIPRISSTLFLIRCASNPLDL